MRSDRIDAVIVHYHAAAALREAVGALRDVAREDEIDLRIFVADNGSTADERAILESLEITLLDIGRNAGYAGAINAAFPSTSADSIILMNEDVLVLPGCLRALHSELQSGAGVAGPQFFWDRGRTFVLPCTEERTPRNELLKAAGKRSLRALERARRRWRNHARRHWQADQSFHTTALSGALLAFRRSAWNRIGPFDDAYQLYFEENDWLMRMERAGLQCKYVPHAHAIHLHNPSLATSPQRSEWEARSFARFGERYYGHRVMQRLVIASREDAVVPQWPILDDVLPIAGRPVWIEVTPSPYGYPAAARRIEQHEPLPLTNLHFVSAPLYVQIVDDEGRELARGRWSR